MHRFTSVLAALLLASGVARGLSENYTPDQRAKGNIFSHFNPWSTAFGDCRSGSAMYGFLSGINVGTVTAHADAVATQLEIVRAALIISNSANIDSDAEVAALVASLEVNSATIVTDGTATRALLTSIGEDITATIVADGAITRSEIQKAELALSGSQHADATSQLAATVDIAATLAELDATWTRSATAGGSTARFVGMFGQNFSTGLFTPVTTASFQGAAGTPAGNAAMVGLCGDVTGAGKLIPFSATIDGDAQQVSLPICGPLPAGTAIATYNYRPVLTGGFSNLGGTLSAFTGHSWNTFGLAGQIYGGNTAAMLAQDVAAFNMVRTGGPATAGAIIADVSTGTPFTGGVMGESGIAAHVSNVAPVMGDVNGLGLGVRVSSTPTYSTAYGNGNAMFTSMFGLDPTAATTGYKVTTVFGNNLVGNATLTGVGSAATPGWQLTGSYQLSVVNGIGGSKPGWNTSTPSTDSTGAGKRIVADVGVIGSCTPLMGAVSVSPTAGATLTVAAGVYRLTYHMSGDSGVTAYAYSSLTSCQDAINNSGDSFGYGVVRIGAVDHPLNEKPNDFENLNGPAFNVYFATKGGGPVTVHWAVSRVK